MSWDDDHEADDERARTDVYDAESRKPRICAHMCATCIMRPSSIVAKGLRPGRLDSLLDEVRRTQGFVVCHSTFGERAAICVGVAKVISSQAVRIAERLGGLIEIDPDQKGQS